MSGDISSHSMPRTVTSLKPLLVGLCSLSLSAGLVSTPAAAQQIAPRFGIDLSTPRNGDDGRVFGQVSAFFPISQTLQNNLTFISTSGRLNTAGNFGGSVSLGHRLALNERTILGGYLAYDARDTGRRTFSQVGLGAELLGENWNASVNGYVPIGTTRALVEGAAGTGQATSAFFQGNQLLLNTIGLQEFESALGGVDVGVGVKLGDFGEYGNLWGTGTAYYLADTLGGSFQLDHRLADRFRFGAGVQSDGIFGTQAFLSVGMRVGGASAGAESEDTRSWTQVAGRDIRRNSSVVVRSQTQGSGTGTTVAAINPSTGQAYRIQHVVPDSAMANQGDGTPENPFTTLGTGSADPSNTALRGTGAGDVVYVRAGDSRTNNLSRFTVSSGVQVYSDAAATTLNTQLGEVTLPDSGTGLRPLVDGNNNNAITLAGNNILVSGFETTNASIGIVADGANGAVIQNNITNNSTNGGLLVRSSDNVTVQNNIANNNSEFGIAVVGLTNATVQGNQLANNQTLDFTSPFSAPAGLVLTQVTGTVTISENTVEGTAIGPTPASGVLTGTDALEGQGIGLVNTSGIVDLTIENNTVSRNQGDGIVIGLAASAEASVAIIDNTIEGNGGTNPLRGDGIKIAGEDNSTITQLRIEDNRVNNNIDDGIDVSLNQVRPTSATISNAIIRNNTVNGSVNGQGIILRTNQSGSMQISVEDNTINNNGSDGLLAQSEGSSQLCLALTGNTSNDGFQLSEGGSSTFTVVDLGALSTINSGTLSFNPEIADFDSVGSINACPSAPGPVVP